MYIPLYTYTKESRYNAYFDFLVRSRGLAGSGKVTKSVFVEKAGLDRRTARTIWDNLSLEGGYLRRVSKEAVYTSKRSSTVVCYVDKEVYSKVRTLPDFKLFVTALQSAKPNEYGNRSRTLRTIGKSTGTEYKQTVHNRVKKAEKKLGLSHTQRFVKVGDKTAQVSSVYGFDRVSFHFNKFTPTSIETSHKARARELKNNATRLEITNKKGKMVTSDFYYDYALIWGKSFTI